MSYASVKKKDAWFKKRPQHPQRIIKSLNALLEVFSDVFIFIIIITKRKSIAMAPT